MNWSEEQKKEFKELYEKYYRYVYKYEVGHEDHFDITNVIWQIDMENFAQVLDDSGMCIKVVKRVLMKNVNKEQLDLV